MLGDAENKRGDTGIKEKWYGAIELLGHVSRRNAIQLLSRNELVFCYAASSTSQCPVMMLTTFLNQIITLHTQQFGNSDQKFMALVAIFIL